MFSSKGTFYFYIIVIFKKGKIMSNKDKNGKKHNLLAKILIVFTYINIKIKYCFKTNSNSLCF